MTQHVEYWRPGSPETPAKVWTRHGLNTAEDSTEEVPEDVLIFTGPVNEDGTVGPLEWRTLPSRYGPPTWRFPSLDLLESEGKAWAVEHDRMLLVDDETGAVVRALNI